MSKLVSLQDAAALVPSGCTLALGGMTLYRRPVAMVRALLAAGTADLTLLTYTGGFESDVLVGARRVRRVRTCYFGLEGFGLAPMFTRRATAGEIEVVEESEVSLAAGLRATLAGVGFMPGRAWRGTDLPGVRPDVKTIQDPYSGEELTAFPALAVDVAIVHVPLADPLGNAWLGGNLAIDRELAMAAERTIVTAEQVVDRLPDKADLVGLRVAAVVAAPGGAWPTSCYPNYGIDGDEILDYMEACSAGQFDAYLARLLAKSS